MCERERERESARASLCYSGDTYRHPLTVVCKYPPPHYHYVSILLLIPEAYKYPPRERDGYTADLCLSDRKTGQKACTCSRRDLQNKHSTHTILPDPARIPRKEATSSEAHGRYYLRVPRNAATHSLRVAFRNSRTIAAKSPCI